MSLYWANLYFCGFPNFHPVFVPMHKIKHSLCRVPLGKPPKCTHSHLYLVLTYLTKRCFLFLLDNVMSSNLGRAQGHIPMMGHVPMIVLMTGHVPMIVLMTGHVPMIVLMTGHAPMIVLMMGHVPIIVLMTGHVPMIVLMTGHVPMIVSMMGHAPRMGHVPVKRTLLTIRQCLLPQKTADHVSGTQIVLIINVGTAMLQRRIPAKKLASLFQKHRKLRKLVRKYIKKSVPKSSKIHCYTCAFSYERKSY